MALIRERILHRWSRITLDLNQHGSSRDRQPALIRDEKKLLKGYHVQYFAIPEATERLLERHKSQIKDPIASTEMCL